MIPFSLVVAMDAQNGIGKDGRLPWHLPGDLKHFKDVTCQVKDPTKNNLVIMGRKTWESISEKFQPLPKRINCVLTRNKNFNFPEGVIKTGDLPAALSLAENKKLEKQIESIFVIGGAQIFQTAIQSSNCRQLYVTHILQTFPCDAFFPNFTNDFQLAFKSTPCSENGISYYFAEYAR